MPEKAREAFLIGVDCDTVSISFETSPEYTSHAYVSSHPDFNGIDQRMVNYGNNRFFRTWEWLSQGEWSDLYSFTKFHLWIDPRFTISTADLELQGSNHNSAYRTNEAELLKVTEAWDEEVITYNSQPSSDTTILVFMDSTSSTTQDRTVDISDFCNYWKANNTLNYGVKFQLELYNDVRARQRFHSPNATASTDRPVIEFFLDLYQGGTPAYCHPVYVNLERKLSGAKHIAQVDHIYFAYDNEYASASANLDYQIFANGNRLTPVMDGTTDALALNSGSNEFKLDVSSLTTGDIYLLQVTNDKGEKRYLRFEKD